MSRRLAECWPACGIAVVTTICCAGRWWLVARGLGVPLPFGVAITACYRCDCGAQLREALDLIAEARAVLVGAVAAPPARSASASTWRPTRSLILVLSVYVARPVGAWVLAIGVVPWLRGPLAGQLATRVPPTLLRGEREGAQG